IQLIPVGESIIYAQPIYVRQTGSQGYPLFRFMVVVSTDTTKDPAQGETMTKALDNLLLGSTAPPSSNGNQNNNPPPAGNQTVQQLLEQANQKFIDAQAALRNGDFARYGQLIQDAQNLVSQALAAAGGSSSTSTTTTTAPRAAASGGLGAGAGTGAGGA